MKSEDKPDPHGHESLSGRVSPGDILADKYRVEQVLGSGGMGVVVAAEHIELREKVAIKFLLDEAASDSELSERFLREARAAVKIKSEHVVRVIDVGRLPSGAPYMVMEHLTGEDLSERVARGPLPISDAVDYIIQACEAMNVAHHAGIVHRDLKPANLFLTARPDGSPVVKVLDFGISKVTSPETAQLSLTRTQAMMGSPLYMAPEQMRSSKDVDRRADIWSLGVILYELLAGDVPFSGSTFPEVLVKVMTDPAPPLRALRPDVPAALETIVQRCLAKSPGQRPSSVAALAVALAPFASARSVALHERLSRSLSDPPVDAPRAPDLGATRIEANPAPAIAAERDHDGRDAHRTHKTAESDREALPLGTNTSWEETRERVVPPRVNLRWLGAAVVSLALGALAVLSLRGGGSRPLHEAIPGAAGLTAVAAVPSAAVVDPAPAVSPAVAATSDVPKPLSAQALPGPGVGGSHPDTDAVAATPESAVSVPPPAARTAAQPAARAARARRSPASKVRETAGHTDNGNVPARRAEDARTSPAPAAAARTQQRGLSIDFK